MTFINVDDLHDPIHLVRLIPDVSILTMGAAQN